MNKKEMLLNAIDSHIKLLHRDIDGYRAQRNFEAIRDIYEEIRRYKNLKNEL